MFPEKLRTCFVALVVFRSEHHTKVNRNLVIIWYKVCVIPRIQVVLIKRGLTQQSFGGDEFPGKLIYVA